MSDVGALLTLIVKGKEEHNGEGKGGHNRKGKDRVRGWVFGLSLCGTQQYDTGISYRYSVRMWYWSGWS